MLAMMLVAHLLGDYVLQFNVIARWKARSVWGVVAHGAIVTLTTLVCAILVDLAWWPYALFIGVTHTMIDVVKARVIHAEDTKWDMVFYLLDQGVHLLVIVLTVGVTGGLGQMEHRAPFEIITPQMLIFAIGYLLLLQPGWVLLRFIVRGMWGAEAAPHLGAGEKFEPMVERVFITTLVLLGQFYLVPLVLLPRRLTTIKRQGNGMLVWMRLTSHWAETVLSVMLAVMVGVALRLVMLQVY